MGYENVIRMKRREEKRREKKRKERKEGKQRIYNTQE